MKIEVTKDSLKDMILGLSPNYHKFNPLPSQLFKFGCINGSQDRWQWGGRWQFDDMTERELSELYALAKKYSF